MTTHTFAHGGARTDSALDNANRVDQQSALVVIEIGGNDLLYGAPDFEQNLEAILKAVCNGKRQVVMLELPLPPTYNRYGIAQRTLARQYNVVLIPKRCLARIITTDGATTDSLHLSNTGHQLTANALAGYFTRADK